MKRSNPDKALRAAERRFLEEPSPENLELLNVQQRRSGEPVLRVFEYGEGWQAQTKLGVYTVSSATASHDGWWGVDHVYWKDDENEAHADAWGIRPLGNHFIRRYPGAKPTKKEVIEVHRKLVEKIRKDGFQGLRGYYRHNPDETLRAAERKAFETDDAEDVARYWSLAFRAGEIG